MTSTSSSPYFVAEPSPIVIKSDFVSLLDWTLVGILLTALSQCVTTCLARGRPGKTAWAGRQAGRQNGKERREGGKEGGEMGRGRQELML